MTRSFKELVAYAERSDVESASLTREECIEAAQCYAESRRAHIRQRHAEGESGSNVVHMLAETADTVLRGVFQIGFAVLNTPRVSMSRMCLCALGGYGRGELNPGSDLDVCLLYEGEMDASMQAFNEFLVPFLWDVGFSLGYGIRSVAETESLAREDVRAFTSLLESRMICGESSVFARLKLFIRELQASPQTHRVLHQKLRERFEELPSEYGNLFAPEPNIKENAGGLRDFHTALWLFMMSHDIDDIDEVAAQGLITEEEHLNFMEALDFLWRIRNELHFRAGTADDRLTYANQNHVARAFGYNDTGQSGVLLLMQDYYASANKMRRFLTIAARICNTDTPQVSLPTPNDVQRDIIAQDGQLFVGIHDPNWFAHNPARLMEVYWLCAKDGLQLSHNSERMVMKNLHLVNDAFRANELVRRFFVALCSRPLHAGMALRQAAASGLLGRYLPEFQEIQGVMRYEDFHHYPVDEHTLLAVESLARIAEMDGPVGRCLQEALDNLSDPYIVVLAILFHDLGKALGEAHTPEGVARTRRIGDRIGLPEEDTERIAFLVEHHMLMNTISQYRDIDDEHIVTSFVHTVKTEQRLRALFLLSFADLYAVGPNVWNDWKGTLLMQLYLKTMKRLVGRAETVGEEYWKSAKAQRVRELVRTDLADAVTDHLYGLGQRYFVAFTPEQIADHLVGIEEAKESGLAVHCSEDDFSNQSEIMVFTKDQHGLFAILAGTFSSHLLDVNSAAVFTRSDGYVVDRFTVVDARQRRPLTKAQLRAVESTLYATLIHGKNIDELVQKARQRLFALLQPRLPVPTRIQFDNQSAREYTVIDIETGDRTGLLYDIVRAITDAGLDIETARIVTDARRVRDSFYVHRNYEKITTEAEQNAVREYIHNAIHPRSSQEAKGGAL